MSLHAVIFDLDGTLLDSLRDIADALNHSLKRNHLPVHDLTSIRRFVGNGVERLVFRSLPEKNRVEKTMGHVLRHVREYYATHWNRSTRPYPGIPELLGKLRERNVEMGVLSNKPVEFTQEMTRHYFPEISFSSIIGAGSGVPMKPDPGGILDLMKAHAWCESETAMVGDSDADIRAALGAKVMAVGVSWGFREAEELKLAGAHYIVSTPEEILALTD